MVAVPPERRQSPRADDPERRGRRSEPRALIGLRTSTETLHGRGDATLLDLSCAGAQLEGQGLPELGRDVLLTCGAIEIFGTVAWAADGRCGVSFDEPISRQIVSELRRTAAKAGHSRMTQEEMEAAADWLNGLAR
jgi:hypothetical protein